MGGSDEDKFDHPTQKPLELMRRPIVNHTQRGESVYDPFLGSGTTLMAAELTGRVCYGLELDPKYVDVIVGRWQAASGKNATLEGTGTTFQEVQSQRRQEAGSLLLAFHSFHSPGISTALLLCSTRLDRHC